MNRRAVYEARQEALKTNPAFAAAMPQGDEPPELMPGAGPAWAAFCALSRDRASGPAGPGAIPFASLDAYARRFHIDGAAFETLYSLVAALDAAYLKHFADKQQKAAKKP